jgi:uncharacterized SAM-binding protein YcdF (DUF218 family)
VCVHAFASAAGKPLETTINIKAYGRGGEVRYTRWSRWLQSMERRRRTVWKAGVAAAIVLLVVGFVPRLGEMLIVSQPLEAPDAILSLASHEWERLPVTAELATRYPHARVLLTEPLNVNAYNCHLCAERVAVLEHLGVAPERVTVLPERVYRTYDEAAVALRYAEAHGIGRLLVVTSAYHTRRTLVTFRGAFGGSGISIGVQPAVGETDLHTRTWWAHGYDRGYVWYEWQALAFYAVRFGVWPFGGADHEQAVQRAAPLQDQPVARSP